MAKRKPLPSPKVNEDFQGQLAQHLEAVALVDAEIEQREQELASLRKERDTLIREDIPALFLTVGVDRAKTMDGQFEVRIVNQLKVSIAGKFRVPILSWLRDNGLSDIIKSEVSVLIPPGKDTLRTKLLETCEKRGLEAKSKETVHNQTLTALLKERRENGEDVPVEELGVYEYREAVVKTAN